MKLGEHFKKAMQDVFDGGHMNASLTEDMRPEALLLSATWWQALGRARGWGTYEKGWKDSSRGIMIVGQVSLLNWHRFIDTLAAGKNADSFFAAL